MLWGPVAGEGRPIIARAWVALPHERRAQVAEAHGAAIGLGMIARLRPDARVVDVAGDNLAVVRFCAGYSRLRRPAMQAMLSARLGALEDAGWVLRWRAVRRRLTGEADRVATQAVYWAASLGPNGRATFAAQWLPGAADPPDCRAHTLPTA